MADDSGDATAERSIVKELGLALEDTPFEVDRDSSGPDRVVFRVRGSESGHPRYGLRPGEDGVSIHTDGSGRVEVSDSSTGHHRLLSLFLLVRAPYLLLLIVLFRAAVRALGLRPRVSDALLSRIPTDSDVAALVRRAVGFGGWREEEVRRAADTEAGRMSRAGTAVADPEDLTEGESTGVAASAPVSERAVADGLASAFGAVGRRIAQENAREIVDLGPTPLVGRRYEALLGRHSGAPRWDELPLSVRRRALGQVATMAGARLRSSCGRQVEAAILAGVRAVEGTPGGPGGRPLPSGPGYALPEGVLRSACSSLATDSLAAAVRGAYLATHPDADETLLTVGRVRAILSRTAPESPVHALVGAVRSQALPSIQRDSAGVAEWLASTVAMDDPTVDLVSDHGIDGAALRQAAAARADWPHDAVGVVEASGGLGAMRHGDFSAYGAAATALASRCPDELAAAADGCASALLATYPGLAAIANPRLDGMPPARELAVCYLEDGVPGLAAAALGRLGVPLDAIGPDPGSRLQAVAVAACERWADPGLDPARALASAATSRCGDELRAACAEARGKALAADPDWRALGEAATMPVRVPRHDPSDPARIVTSSACVPLHMAGPERN